MKSVKTGNYDSWLEHLNEQPSIGKVPSNKYFAVRIQDNSIVGMGMLRTELNDYLKQYEGHIGYSVRPTEQNQGYATEILHLLLEEAHKTGIDEVLVTCDIENKASAKSD